MTKRKYIELRFVFLLLCLWQVAGIAVYAQEGATDLPKALQRRMDKESEQQQLADSLERVNQKSSEQTEAAVVPELPVTPLDSAALQKKAFIPNPTKATWLAVVFPGGGQIYNRKYWKLPIVYGGFAGCAYALSWNSKMYKDYSQAYMDIMDKNPTTNSYLELLPPNHNYSEDQLKEVLRKRKDLYRRYRDMSVFAFIGVYLLSIVDAYVDAELSNFDLTPDLSMRVEPTLFDDKHLTNSKTVGVQCSFRF